MDVDPVDEPGYGQTFCGERIYRHFKAMFDEDGNIITEYVWQGGKPMWLTLTHSGDWIDIKVQSDKSKHVGANQITLVYVFLDDYRNIKDKNALIDVTLYEVISSIEFSDIVYALGQGPEEVEVQELVFNPPLHENAGVSYEAFLIVNDKEVELPADFIVFEQDGTGHKLVINTENEDYVGQNIVRVKYIGLLDLDQTSLTTEFIIVVIADFEVELKPQFVYPE